MTDPDTLVGTVEVRLLEVLGTGGFGTVHRGYQPTLDRPVAVKVLRAELGPEAEQRLVAEARIVARMPPHPGIVAVHAVGSDGGRPFLVMELVTGGTLEAELADGPMPLARVLSVGAWLAAALETAHRFGVVHGDVKAANVLLTGAGHPKLADFGVAAALAGPTAPPMTPSSAAPERLAGGAPDIAGDIWALGSLLRRCLARGTPGDDPVGRARLAELVDEMTDDDPPARPASMAAVLERLLAIEAAAGATPTPAVVLEGEVDELDLDGTDHRAPPTDPPLVADGPASRRRAGRIVAACGAVALVAGAFALGRTTAPRPAPTRRATTSTTDIVPLTQPGIGKYPLLLYVPDPLSDAPSGLVEAERTRLLAEALGRQLGPVSGAPERRDLQLNLNRLPARVRLQAFNSIRNDTCNGVRTGELHLLADSEQTWTVMTPSGPVTAAGWVTTASDPTEAHALFLVEALFAGIPAESCRGFPSSGIGDGTAGAVTTSLPAGLDTSGADEVGVWEPTPFAPRWVATVRRGTRVVALLLTGASITLDDGQRLALAQAVVSAAAPD